MSPRTVRRIGLTFAAWATYASIQLVLGLVAQRSLRIDAMSIAYAASIAIAWTVFSLAIAAWTRALDRMTLGAPGIIAGHLAGFAVTCMADAAWQRATLVAMHIKLIVPVYATALYYADLNAAAYLAVLVVTRIVALEDLGIAQARRQLGLRAQLAQARLDYLEAQLQPHFLFNSLGTITELAHEAPAAAARMLRQLATLLRFAAREDGHVVTLREELRALEPYLDIQRVRFSDWVTIEQHVAPEALDAMVPRLSLQPLVENAIRHGLGGRTERGLIRITADRIGNRLMLAVQDDGVGLSPATTSAGYGIGLQNMRHRLAAAYDDDFTMNLHAVHGGGAVAEVDIPVCPPGASTIADEPDVSALRRAPGRILDWMEANPTLAVVLGWSAWGLCWFQLSYGYLAMRHRLASQSITIMVRDHVVAVVLWALLTPVVFAAARRLPLRGSPANALLHVPIACVLALAHVAAWETFTAPAERLWSPRYEATMLWTVLLYAILLGIAQYRDVEAWYRERETANDRLQADLAEARTTAATVRFRPVDVLERLESLADRVHLDPTAAESELAHLADDLRRNLD